MYEQNEQHEQEKRTIKNCDIKAAFLCAKCVPSVPKQSKLNETIIN
jgi:hypothetical protein